LRNEIEHEQNNIDRTSGEKDKATGKINKAEAALASHMGSVELAAANERIVEESTQEKNEEEELEANTETEQAQNIKALENEDEDEKMIFDTSIATLEAQIEKDQAELTSLETGKHSLHEQWEALRNELQATIEQREATIKDEQSKIALSEKKASDTEAAREATNKDFDEAIAGHTLQTEKLDTEKKSQRGHLGNREERA